ncbi:MAG: polyphosphate kinase 2 family protein [Leadbetterella sp.]|nr:polyphosphate kinase 2 family protein [Leadbetterella sp.]
MKKFNIKDYQITGSEKFNAKDHPTKINDFYKDKADYEAILKSLQTEMDELQSIMYAHSKYGVLAVFQAMDAAGKDGTMKAVFQGVHPLGLSFYSFKRPSETELNHDYMWRCYKELPERGKMQVFNRSYYEEVLVVKVHPEILENYQKIPDELKGKDVWKKRYQDIKNFEDYLANNGIIVLKFFLNVSKEEQGNRLIERIEDITKNWKFEEGDIKERSFWNNYQEAYAEMINETSTVKNPWYVVPADDKKNMRLIVAKIIVEKLKELKMSYPEPDEARKQTLLGLIDTIKQQNLE